MLILFPLSCLCSSVWPLPSTNLWFPPLSPPLSFSFWLIRLLSPPLSRWPLPLPLQTSRSSWRPLPLLPPPSHSFWWPLPTSPTRVQLSRLYEDEIVHTGALFGGVDSSWNKASSYQRFLWTLTCWIVSPTLSACRRIFFSYIIKKP